MKLSRQIIITTGIRDDLNLPMLAICIAHSAPSPLCRFLYVGMSDLDPTCLTTILHPGRLGLTVMSVTVTHMLLCLPKQVLRGREQTATPQTS